MGSERRGKDSEELLDLFLGKQDQGREELILEATGRTALQTGEWVMIPPYNGPPISKNVNIEIGNAPEYQLYNLNEDLGEQNNLAQTYPDKLKALIGNYEAIMGETEEVSGELELK